MKKTDKLTHMARPILFPVIILLYASMTCIHIPIRFNAPEPLKIRSPFLLAEADFPVLGPESASIGKKAESGSGLFSAEPSENAEKNVKTETYNIPLPEFTRGIYISNYIATSKTMLERFIREAREYRINTFVVDVQSHMIRRDSVEMIKRAGIFPVARVVVFLGGLNQKVPDEKYVNQILSTIEAAAHEGFLEVQLDYIRYADNTEMEKLPLEFKYQTINHILKRAREKATSLSIFLSADLFGRVTLNQHDHIGQKLENFSQYMDAIYPMLYPSHYTNDEYRISHPYETVKEGVANSVKRCTNTRIIAYIQGFTWRIDQSGKNLPEYVRLQLQAVEDGGGHGWVIWNAKNEYRESYDAISVFDTARKKRITETGTLNKGLM